MSRTRVLRRLSTTVLAGAVVCASPFVFQGIASAAPATQQVIFTDAGAFASYKFDGLNSTVDLTAVVQRATFNSPQAISERWSYSTDLTCNTGLVQIGVDPLKQTVDPTANGDGNNLFYSSLEWTPPATNNYCVRAELLDGNGTLITTTDKTVFVSSILDSANFTLPAKGGYVGYYDPTPSVAGGGTLTVAGVASSIIPGQIAGLGTASLAGVAGPVAVVNDGLSTNWGAVLPENTLFSSLTRPTASANSFIADAFTGSVLGFEVRPAVTYRVTKVNSFTAAPTTAFKLPGNTLANRARYVITALDQKGNPIGGLRTQVKFTDPNDNSSFCAYQIPESGDQTGAAFAGNGGGCVNGGTATNNASLPSFLTTNVFGKIVLDVYDADAEILPFFVRTNFDVNFGADGFNSAVDFSDALTLSTVPQVPASGSTTVAGHPTFSVYPTQTYGNPALGPQITVNVKDQNGNTIVQPASQVEYQYTRTITSGTTALGAPGDIGTCTDNTVYPLASAVMNAGNPNGDGNDVITPDAVSGPCNDNESGSDAFTIWVEVNGTPGYQAGDILLGQPVVKFGPERIYFVPCDPSAINLRDGGYNDMPQGDCEAQVKTGTDKTVELVDTIFDGATFVPVTGRTLDIFLQNFNGTVGTDSGFTATNPGIHVLVPNHATCVTGATDGMCSVTVFSTTDDFNSTVNASDPSLGGTSSDNGNDQIRFRNFSAVINTTTVVDLDRIEPSGTRANVPGSAGEPARYRIHLADQNGNNLRNEVITLNTTQGFFTPLPVDGSDSYTALTFATDVPADQAAIKGDIKSLGTSEQTVSDDNGDVWFTIGTLKDAGYDATGDISGMLTATFASQTKTLVNGTLYSTNFARDGGNPVAAGTFNVIEGNFANTGQFLPGTTKPSGEKAVASVNSIPSDTVDTIIKETDSFGNLISTPVTGSISGPGFFSAAGVFTGAASVGSYNNDYLTSATPAGKVTRYINPTSQNPATGDATVTFTSALAANTWLVNTVTQVVAVNSLVNNVTDNYKVTWYIRGATGLAVTVDLSPSATVNAGTPINVSAHVADAHGRSVKGLGIQFFVSGPNNESSQTPNPFTCVGNQCTNAVFTDANGKGGYTFSSTHTGGVTITTVVTDLNGNEVYRHVDHASYIGVGKPRIAQVSHKGVVTLTLTTDPQEAGKTAIFFRRSGITGVVVPLGTGIISNTGVANRTFNSPTGGILALYGKVLDPSLPDPYTNNIAFKVQ